MKHILIFLFLLCVYETADAQQIFRPDAVVISCGGGPFVAHGSGFGGSATVGLPFVGGAQNGQYQSKLGLYVDLHKNGKSAVPLSKAEKSMANIYSNPTKGDITINLPQDIGTTVHVALFDEHGGELGVLQYTLYGTDLHAKVADRADGIYFIRFT